MCRCIARKYIGLHLSTTIKFYASINLLNSCSIKIQWKMHFNNMLLLDNEIQGLMKLYFLNMNIAWKKSFEGFFFVFSICFSFCGHSNEHECHKRLFEHLFLLIRKYISVRALVWKITATNVNVLRKVSNYLPAGSAMQATFIRFSYLVLENCKKPELQYTNISIGTMLLLWFSRCFVIFLSYFEY